MVSNLYIITLVFSVSTFDVILIVTQ